MSKGAGGFWRTLGRRLQQTFSFQMDQMKTVCQTRLGYQDSWAGLDPGHDDSVPRPFSGQRRLAGQELTNGRSHSAVAIGASLVHCARGAVVDSRWR